MVRRFSFRVLSLTAFALLVREGALRALPASSPVELLQNAVDADFDERYDDSIRFYNAYLEVDPANKAARKGLKNAEKRREEQIRKQRAAERVNFDAVSAYTSQGRLVEASDRIRDIAARIPGHSDVV